MEYEKILEKIENTYVFYWKYNGEIYGTIKLNMDSWVYESYGQEFKDMCFLESFFKFKGDKKDGINMLLYLKNNIQKPIFTFTFVPYVYTHFTKHGFVLYKTQFIPNLETNVNFLLLL